MDFELEFAEYPKFGFVKNISKKQESDTNMVMEVTTLEDKVLVLDCSLQGIMMDGVNYENMEQILNKYSPLYVQKFQQDLFAKLSILQQQQNNESSSDEDLN